MVGSRVDKPGPFEKWVGYEAKIDRWVGTEVESHKLVASKAEPDMFRVEHKAALRKVWYTVAGAEGA